MILLLKKMVSEISETEGYDTSFESPNIWLLEFEMKMGGASSWKVPRPFCWNGGFFNKVNMMPSIIMPCQVSFHIQVATY